MSIVDISFFTKSKRASNAEDYESWKRGGVIPTLNRIDNSGDSFATVLIVVEESDES